MRSKASLLASWCGIKDEITQRLAGLMSVAIRGPPFVADGTFGDLYRADLTNLRHIFAVIFFLDFAFVRAVDLFDTDVQAGQEYSVLMAKDLTVSHSVPLKRSPCFFEGFFADDPNG
jgi:hypothetical protein